MFGDKNSITKPERAPLNESQKKTVLIAGGIVAVLLLLAVGLVSFFISKSLTAPETLAPVEPDRVIQDDYKSEYDKKLETVSQPGDVIQEGSKASIMIGADGTTNHPMIGQVQLDSVREADPTTVTGYQMDGPLLGEENARFWYVEITMTFDEKPTGNGHVPFPIAVSNDKRPGDEVPGMIFRHDNPECLYGPERWEEVTGNSVTRCYPVATFNNEPIDKVFLVMPGLDYGEYPEYASNPTQFEYTITTTKE